MKKYYYTIQGIEHGPVSGGELRRLAESDALKKTDFVWQEDQQRRQAGAVKGLFPQPETDSIVPVGRSENEKFCESCGAVIHAEINICPKCGVKQKTAGIIGFVKKQIGRINARIAIARSAIDEEMKLETGISTPHKVIAVIVALSAGWTGLTGLGSIIAGRKKAGFSMLGLPLFLGLLTFGCLTATFFSAIASIFVVGIPFFIMFGTFSMVLLPLFATTYIGFYIADVMICINAK